MKKIILLTVISIGIIALIGCGVATEKAKTDTPKNTKTDTPKNTNTETNQNKEPAKNVFKPVEISPDAVKVKDLIDKVVANLNNWKGKEVKVTGYVTAISGKGGEDGYALTLTNDEMGGSENNVGCYVKNEDKPEGIMGKAVEVSGTVSGMDSDKKGKSVYLQSCSLKK